ncbi:hypothetical protein C8Q80DRAFT_1162032 [Daedaleopsis nitida]|nr:hypothetical protein C8Q80DRAFT_1162032 [Daedaleopsis nitida]
MFKRIEKKIRKKEKEEELGLDEDMKEMLGMNADTDSDESDSSSDSENDENDEEGMGLDASDGEEESDAGAEDDEEGDEHEGDEEQVLESEPESDDEDEEPPMSVSEALQNPLYVVSLEPEVRACIVCPGKLLKNPVMIDVHMKSGAHTRRYTHLRESAMDVDADTDVRELVRARQAGKPSEASEDKLSRRAQKKARLVSRLVSRFLHPDLPACVFRKPSWPPSRQSARSRRS